MELAQSKTRFRNMSSRKPNEISEKNLHRNAPTKVSIFSFASRNFIRYMHSILRFLESKYFKSIRFK